MKKFSAPCIALLASISGVAIADPITWNNVPAPGSSDDSSVYTRKQIDSYDYTPKKTEPDVSVSEKSEYKYESVTGTKYKYDLSKPEDKIKYSVDPAAKVMDDVNPMVEIDKGLGQDGGGSEL